MLDIHLDSIKFSFQSADEGTYNEMRGAGIDDAEKEKILELQEYKKNNISFLKCVRRCLTSSLFT